MRPADSVASTILSGGRTRRAAKMVILDVDHPDIEEFIETKVNAERVANSLRDAGFDIGLNGRDSIHVQYQNANNSVRVTDEFMGLLDNNGQHTLKPRNGGPSKTVSAADLYRSIAEAAHVCGDPGIQYHDTINRWHTCKQDGEIVGSNPCSEYMFLDNTVCNLASLNLVKFHDKETGFDVEGFREAVAVFITAMDIIVNLSSYPSSLIETNTKRYRTLGLGFTNLGSLLMRLGIPYDSDEGRDVAGAITGLLQGQAYRSSIKLAEKLSAYPAYQKNSSSHWDVLRMHSEYLPDGALTAYAQPIWQEAVRCMGVDC